jgi:hypothetical protein
VPRYGQIDGDYGRRLRSPDRDGPVYMLGLTRLLPGHSKRTLAPSLSGQSAEAVYAPVSLLAGAGATLCFAADVLASTGGWDRVAVIWYPTRRSFVELAYQRNFQDWHVAKEQRMERTTVMSTLPVAGLPAPAWSGRILLEAWSGPPPGEVAPGPLTAFAVEGTIIGDGRRWDGVRYTVIEPGTALPLDRPGPRYQALLLEPTIERWR